MQASGRENKSLSDHKESKSSHNLVGKLQTIKKVFANREKFLKGCKVRFVTETKAKEIVEKLRKERM